MRRLLIYLIPGFLSIVNVNGQQAYIQMVHCSADSALAEVDIWVDSVKAFDNVSFRTSTGLYELDTNSGHKITICNGSSIDTIGCFFSDSIFINSNEKYQIFITGCVSTGYTPFKSLRLTKSVALKNAANATGYSEFIVFNGTTDIGKIDLVENTVDNTLLANDLSFAAATGYNTLESFNYTVRLKDSSSIQTIREVAFNLGDQMLSDSAFTLAITGFLDRSVNSNGPALALSIVRSQGGVFIPLNNATARIQLINNSSDPNLRNLDFYVNGNLIADHLKFRNATGYLSVPSGIPFELAVAPPNSTSVDDSLTVYRGHLESGASYVGIASGLETSSISPFKPITISTFQSKRIANTGYNCEIAFAHGATDLDGVRIDEVSSLNTTLFDVTTFAEISDYITVPSADYEIQLISNTTETVLKSYRANLSQSGGEAQTWLLSGFADTNQSDSSNRIGIFVAHNTGGPVTELNGTTGIANRTQQRIRIHPNPSNGVFSISELSVPTQFNIYSLEGRIVQSDIIQTGDLVDCHHLENGIYYISLDLGSSLETYRIVISK